MRLRLKGKTKYGGCFNDELDAAKRVNELCKELGIPERNPGINGIPNQHWKVTQDLTHYITECISICEIPKTKKN